MTIREQIIAKVEECFQIAERFYNHEFERAREIRFKRNGTTGGSYNHRYRRLTFQLDLAEHNPERYLNEIVQHEVAHCIQFTKYWYSGNRNMKSHGKEWKYIMKNVYGLEPRRTHDMDCSVTKTKRQRRWSWLCNCQEHRVSTRKHNLMTRNLRVGQSSGWRCVKCGSSLTNKKVLVEF